MKLLNEKCWEINMFPGDGDIIHQLVVTHEVRDKKNTAIKLVNSCQPFTITEQKLPPPSVESREIHD